MKKFKDFINENNIGIKDNTKAVKLIVNDFDIIRETIIPLLLESVIDNTNASKDDSSFFSDDSFNSTIIQDSNGIERLKYLGFVFLLDERALGGLDIATVFTNIKKDISDKFDILNDSIYIKDGSNYYFSIDYDTFIKSNYYLSLKGINKYNL